MSELETRFKQAVEEVRNAPTDGPYKPGNEEKLRMYALYRQATDGDVQGKRPGMLNVIERAKYDAWAAMKGTPCEKAMQRYIDAVEAVRAQYG